MSAILAAGSLRVLQLDNSYHPFFAIQMKTNMNILIRRLQVAAKYKSRINDI